MNAAKSVIRRMKLSTNTCTTTAATRALPRSIQHDSLQLHHIKHSFSTISKGQDLLEDALLAHGSKRKIILDSFYPGVGFDVIGMIEYSRNIQDGEHEGNIHHNNKVNYDRDESSVPIPGMRRIRHQKDHNSNPNNKNNFNIDDYDNEQEQILLMNSSIIAFPHSCFLWNNISNSKDVTLESLSIVQLLQPSVEFLFIGCDHPLPPRELNRIRKALKEKSNIVVDQMDVMNAMGTFNILNGEDRRVAVALVVDTNSSSSSNL